MNDVVIDKKMINDYMMVVTTIGKLGNNICQTIVIKKRKRSKNETDNRRG